MEATDNDSVQDIEVDTGEDNTIDMENRTNTQSSEERRKEVEVGRCFGANL